MQNEMGDLMGDREQVAGLYIAEEMLVDVDRRPVRGQVPVDTTRAREERRRDDVQAEAKLDDLLDRNGDAISGAVLAQEAGSAPAQLRILKERDQSHCFRRP